MWAAVPDALSTLPKIGRVGLSEMLYVSFGEFNDKN